MDSQQGIRIDHRRSLLVVAVFALLGLASGCFITNCPPGGKRSDVTFGRIPIRQCSRCGFGGRCFGPAICCSPKTGCLLAEKINSLPLLRPCAIEARLPGACISGSKHCGNSGGRCASDGLCCNDVSCSLDPSCPSHSVTLSSAYHEATHSNAVEDISQIKDYSEEYGGIENSISRF